MVPFLGSHYGRALIYKVPNLGPQLGPSCMVDEVSRLVYSDPLYKIVWVSGLVV